MSALARSYIVWSSKNEHEEKHWHIMQTKVSAYSSFLFYYLCVTIAQFTFFFVFNLCLAMTSYSTNERWANDYNMRYGYMLYTRHLNRRRARIWQRTNWNRDKLFSGMDWIVCLRAFCQPEFFLTPQIFNIFIIFKWHQISVECDEPSENELDGEKRCNLWSRLVSIDK